MCGTSIPDEMCRHPVSTDVEDCFDPVVNPQYGNRPEPILDPSALFGGGSECHEHTEMVYWSDLRVVDKIFKIKTNNICMVIFNNLSGVTYRVAITKLGAIN